MALERLKILKNWLKGTKVREINWDNIRNPLIAWSDKLLNSVIQLGKDTHGSKYSFDNDGLANLPGPLRDAETGISTLDWTFSGNVAFNGDVDFEGGSFDRDVIIKNGFDLIMYLDDEITETLRLDGATGTLSVLGLTVTSFQINDTSSDHQYIVGVSELIANRTVTLPLLSFDDTFVFEGHAQTLTNKTLTSPTINTPTINTATINMDGNRIDLDADNNTSIRWVAGAVGDEIRFQAGGNDVFGVRPDGVDLLTNGQRLYLDSDNDTYIESTADDQMNIYSGGNQIMEFRSTEIRCHNNKLALNDIGNDSIRSTGSELAFEYNGSDVALLDGTRFALGLNTRIILDDDGDTSIRCSADDILEFQIAGSDRVTFSANGEILLPNVNPPTANYANRNGIVKGWVNTFASGAIQDSYNVSSVDDDAAGDKGVNWDTNFANANYACAAIAGNPNPRFISVDSQATTSLELEIYDDAGVKTDSNFRVIAIGDQ